MQAGNISLAVAQAQAALSVIPSRAILAFAIGNEPDLYEPRGERPTGWFPDGFFAEFAAFRDAVQGAVGSTQVLAGPSWAGYRYANHTQGRFLKQVLTRLCLLCNPAAHHIHVPTGKPCVYLRRGRFGNCAVGNALLL